MNNEAITLTHASKAVFNGLKNQPVSFLQEMYELIFTERADYDTDVAGGVYAALEYNMGADAADEWADAMFARIFQK